MKSGNTLIIFMDGVSNNYFKKYGSVDDSFKLGSFNPGIGFSNNLYPEMLCGLNPDQIGYFNEWSPVKKVKNTLLYSLLRPFDLFYSLVYPNAGIRKIILNKICKLNVANIPYKYRPFFKPSSSHDFRLLGNGNLLDEYGFRIIDAVEYRDVSYRERDLNCLNEIKNTLKNEDTFVSLVDLDNIQHVFGVDSNESVSHFKKTYEHVCDLIKKFTDYDSSNQVIMFSDHGMVDVDKYIPFKIEQSVGEPSMDTYLYFVDATYVRVWVYNENYRKKVTDFFSDISSGRLLSQSERKEFGVTNLDFGDFIFRLDEKAMFLPNFYGGRQVKAMHGYDSKLESQQAMFYTNITDIPLPENSSDVYRFLKRVL